MEEQRLQGKDIEIDINIRVFWKLPDEKRLIETLKPILLKYYNVLEINLDLPTKVTDMDDEIKMDNEKDGSISIKLLDAKYKIRKKSENEETDNLIEHLIEKMHDSLKNDGILFIVWSCTSI